MRSSCTSSRLFNNIDAAVFQELDKQRTSPHERFTKILTPLPENRELVWLEEQSQQTGE
jgi:Tfp pilus assembly protein PilO